jgi:elongation factor P
MLANTPPAPREPDWLQALVLIFLRLHPDQDIYYPQETDGPPRPRRKKRADMETSDIKKGVKIMQDGQPYVVVDFQFVKPGKGQAFTRTKMKNMLTGGVLERNIRSGEKLEAADVVEKTMSYIYPEGSDFVFMDTGSGEQVIVPGDAVGDDAGLLQDGSDALVTIYKGNPVGIVLPPHIIVQIAETEPGVKGDTATNVTKPAKIATGATVNVPLFVNEGDWVRVDTRTRSYLERAKAPG